MPLWNVEQKKEPNFVNTENVIATNRGWELIRPDGTSEVLVVIRNLAEKLENLEDTENTENTVVVTLVKLLKLAASGVNKTLRVSVEFSEAITYTLDDKQVTLTVFNENQSGKDNGDYTLSLDPTESKPELGLLVFKTATPVPIEIGVDGLYVDNSSLDLDGLVITSPENYSVNTTIPYTRLNDVPAV